MGKNELPRGSAQAEAGGEFEQIGHILDLPKRGGHVVQVRG
jgi:hypothetical protein